MVAAPDGSIYLVGGFGNVRTQQTVARLATDGTITIVAGQLAEVGAPGTDEVPATESTLDEPRDIALAPDGSLYVADTNNHKVRKITPDGIIHAFAGTFSGFSGDGGDAKQAQLSSPLGIGLGPDGAVYIADNGNNRVRRVGTDGIITTVAGHGRPSSSTGRRKARSRRLSATGSFHPTMSPSRPTAAY